MHFSTQLRVQVRRRGGSLAVRLPFWVVEVLQLAEGNEIEIEVAGRREFRIRPDLRKQKALAYLKALNWELPAGSTFSRDDANER